jgi:DnaJ-class molecular chaperone
MQSLKWHPDKNQGDVDLATRMFAQIAEAYEVLSSKKLRAVYDKFGEEGLKAPTVGGRAYAFSGDAGRIFEKFFGTSNPFATLLDGPAGPTDPFASAGFGGASGDGPAKAPTVISKLSLTLQELYTGCTKRLKISRRRLQADGRTLRSEQKFLAVRVQPGWRAGTKVTFENEGDERAGVVPADVVFVVAERPHPVFRRVGNDLIFSARIPLVSALTDFSLRVDHLDGRVLNIPCNEVIRPGSVKTVSGEGMPISRQPGARGNLVIEFDVVFPEKLTTAQKKGVAKALA